MNIVRHVVVRGRVQGVGYRACGPRTWRERLRPRRLGAQQTRWQCRSRIRRAGQAGRGSDRGVPGRARARPRRCVDVAEGSSDLLAASAIRASVSRFWERCDMKIGFHRASLVPAAGAPRRTSSRSPRRAPMPRPPTSRSRAMATATRPVWNGTTAAAPAAAGAGERVCSNIGIACQPTAITCTRRDASRAEVVRRSPAPAFCVAPNSPSNSRRSAMSTSGMVDRCARDRPGS